VSELVERKLVSQDVAAANLRLNIVGMVGSIDNDFCGTDMTIGKSTYQFVSISTDLAGVGRSGHGAVAHHRGRGRRGRHGAEPPARLHHRGDGAALRLPGAHVRAGVRGQLGLRARAPGADQLAGAALHQDAARAAVWWVLITRC